CKLGRMSSQRKSRPQREKTLRRINAFVPKLHRQIVGPEGVRRSNCHDLHTNNRQMQGDWGLMN
ncbi:hypothetical protein, partial [Mesorhizobium sp.]|uniref:hypothetical protein n=1 Tax=Mesorhizobium sp. TaxID=1871066 RepID=UPI0025D2038C